MKIIETLKKLNRLLDAKQKKKAVSLFIIMLFGAFWEVLGVSMMLPLVSAMLDPEIIHSNSLIAGFCGFFGIQTHITFVIVCLIALIVLFLIKNLFLIYESYVNTKFVYSNRFLIQQKLMHSFLLKPYEYYLNTSTGDIFKIIGNDVNQSFDLLMSGIGFFTESIVSIAVFITVVVIDPLMAGIITAVLALIVIFISTTVKPKLTKSGNEFREHNRKSNDCLFQAIEGIKTVKAAESEPFFEKRFKNAGIKQVEALQSSAIYNAIPGRLIEIGCICTTIAVTAVLLSVGHTVDAFLPTLAAFAMAARKLMPAANKITVMANSIAYSSPALDSLLEHLKGVDAENGPATVTQRLTIRNTIEIKDLTYQYAERNERVLNGVSFSITVGSSIGIVGKSGSGKTTTVDVLLGLLKPEAGHIIVDGVDVAGTRTDWLSHIGYIPQNVFMIDGTIKENVAFGSEVNDDEVWRALREAQLDEFVKTLPDGLNTEIGERGVRVSGGQGQRIGIARALYKDPEILIWDEATSSLDNETESAILESVNRLHGKKTMIIIAHRLQTIEKCDMVYRISDGKMERER